MSRCPRSDRKESRTSERLTREEEEFELATQMVKGEVEGMGY